MLLSPPSNLEFPSWRAPGFDPTHPASNFNGAGASFLPASGGVYINALTGGVTAKTGTQTYGIGIAGPYVQSQTSANYNSFANSFSTTPSAITIAAIITPVVSEFRRGAFPDGLGQRPGPSDDHPVPRLGLPQQHALYVRYCRHDDWRSVLRGAKLQRSDDLFRPGEPPHWTDPHGVDRLRPPARALRRLGISATGGPTPHSTLVATFTR